MIPEEEFWQQEELESEIMLEDFSSDESSDGTEQCIKLWKLRSSNVDLDRDVLKDIIQSYYGALELQTSTSQTALEIGRCPSFTSTIQDTDDVDKEKDKHDEIMKLFENGGKLFQEYEDTVAKGNCSLTNP